MIASHEVTGEPVEILPTPGQGSAVLPNYQFIAVSNNGGSTVYLKFTSDEDAVSDSNGIALPAGAAMLIDQDDSPIMQNGIVAVCAAEQSSTVAVQAY